MILSRRAMLGATTMGVIAIGTGLLTATKASAHTTQKVPPRSHQKLKAQPPYRHNEDRYRKRLKRSKHKPRLKARSLRAQHTFDTPGARRALALTMWGEARGYGTNGMRLVGHVVMNRVKANKKRFGSGVEGVCFKRKQFSCHNPGEPNKIAMQKLPSMSESNPDWIAFMKADKLAGEILAGIDKDNTGGAQWYFAETMRPHPYWVNDMTIIGVEYGHLLCKEKPRRQRKKSRRARHCTSHSSHHQRKAKHHYDHSHASHHR